MNLIPTVIERSSNGERSYDIYSRLLEDRIIILNDEITDVNKNSLENWKEIPSAFKKVFIDIFTFQRTYSIGYIMHMFEEALKQ